VKRRILVGPVGVEEHPGFSAVTKIDLVALRGYLPGIVVRRKKEVVPSPQWLTKG
jgi:hypothetical protein